MKRNMFFILIMFLINFRISIPKIRILLSAALTEAYFDFRKQQYIESFNILAQYGYKNVYVVEALKKQGPTFLDDYSKNVFYSTANNSFFKNNGVNESLTLLEASYHFKFDPEDIIIKFTGRYQLVSDYLIKLVKRHPEIDAFVLFNKDATVVTGGFAMRCKYFQEMYKEMNYGAMEQFWLPVELLVGNYIKRKLKTRNFKVYYLKKLDMKANKFGSSTALGPVPNEIVYF